MSFSTSQTEFQIEFQGALVKLSMKDGSRIGRISALQEGKIYQQAYAEAFNEAARKLPPDQRIMTPDSHHVYAANLSPAVRHQIEMQAIETARQRAHDRATRGTITEFSRRSRGRLLRLVARLQADASGVFLTVTYRQNMRDHALAKVHLDKLLRWLKYHHPDGSFIWRMEYQQRGAIHFHILCFGVPFIDSSAITKYWQQMTGDESYPDVERIQSRRKATYYVSKYIAKVAPATDQIPTPLMALAARSPRLLVALTLLAANGFILVPYSEKRVFVGRYWGVVNRRKLPLAPLHFCRIVGCADVLHEMRRYARRYCDRIGTRLQGFSLFVRSAERWRRLFEGLLDDSWLPHSQTSLVKGII